MTRDEQHDLVRRHYALNGAGDYDAAADLVTDDFLITIPDYMPFGGTYRGKGAFRVLIPKVREMVAVERLRPVATTFGDDCAVEVVEFTLAGDASPTEVAELLLFQGDQIREVRPYYSDPGRFLAAAARRGKGV